MLRRCTECILLLAHCSILPGAGEGRRALPCSSPGHCRPAQSRHCPSCCRRGEHGGGCIAGQAAAAACGTPAGSGAAFRATPRQVGAAARAPSRVCWASATTHDAPARLPDAYAAPSRWKSLVSSLCACTMGLLMLKQRAPLHHGVCKLDQDGLRRVKWCCNCLLHGARFCIAVANCLQQG